MPVHPPEFYYGTRPNRINAYNRDDPSGLKNFRAIPADDPRQDWARKIADEVIFSKGYRPPVYIQRGVSRNYPTSRMNGYINLPTDAIVSFPDHNDRQTHQDRKVGLRRNLAHELVHYGLHDESTPVHPLIQGSIDNLERFMHDNWKGYSGYGRREMVPRLYADWMIAGGGNPFGMANNTMLPPKEHVRRSMGPGYSQAAYDETVEALEDYNHNIRFMEDHPDTPRDGLDALGWFIHNLHSGGYANVGGWE